MEYHGTAHAQCVFTHRNLPTAKLVVRSAELIVETQDNNGLDNLVIYTLAKDFASSEILELNNMILSRQTSVVNRKQINSDLKSVAWVHL